MRRRLWRFAVWTLRVSGGLLAFYAIFVLVGLWPVNRDFVEDPDGVPIYVLSGPVHTDIVVPVRTADWDWTEHIPSSSFAADAAWVQHYALGWGDRGFYLETPTWADLKASTAFSAILLPTTTVMHVDCFGRMENIEGVWSVRVSDEQYAMLCRSLLESFKTDNRGSLVQIDNKRYSNYDAFFQGRGHYSAFYTCNSWAGDQLKAAGVSTHLATPLPGGFYAWFR